MSDKKGPAFRGVAGALIDLETQRVELIKFNLFENSGTWSSYVNGRDGVGGVLLPAQIADYGVGRATIGICFLMFAAGFILASFSTGGALARLGIRTTLAAGGLGMVLAWLGLASRPPFTVFVALQLAIYLPLTLIVSLLLLQPVKGTVVGLQWALRMHGFDENGPSDDPQL